MSACCCSLAGTAACQTCSQNPFAVMSKLMTTQPTALRDIMVNLQTEKPMTNADRIRSMSDEELAEWVTTVGRTFGEEYEGYMSVLDWLKAPEDVDK